MQPISLGIEVDMEPLLATSALALVLSNRSPSPSADRASDQSPTPPTDACFAFWLCLRKQDVPRIVDRLREIFRDVRIPSSPSRCVLSWTSLQTYLLVLVTTFTRRELSRHPWQLQHLERQPTRRDGLGLGQLQAIPNSCSTVGCRLQQAR